MRYREVTKNYGENCVFNHFSLDIKPNTIMAIVGPSGKGKTTLLQMASGLLLPDEGEVLKEATEVGSVSYLFQEPRLLPQCTVFSNVELALHSAYPHASERASLAMHYLDLVGLHEYIGYYPSQLSGGMRQRVAIARSFAHPSHLVLMDEPFQSLDIKLRYNLLNSFVALWNESPRTTIFVTHDPMEAVLVGDGICCLGKSEKPEMLLKINIPRKARNISDPELLGYEAQLVEALIKD
ncbi:ABC transporter ATP-binding protein [uncultured Sphaerochaeta sp.]|uniref:ABC transporter ATP-binding protein n=1 Tax=uncultured Sphaerochaeta sp. TaxID=886478 RepID=UPI002A0A2FE1|nr:ABC transporter ATP-binding protein [uncultured Sphaerochaeta sp.]